MIKKFLILFLFLSSSVFSSDFSGEYEGKIDNMKSSLIINQINDFITGELITQGYHYQIHGKVVNKKEIKGVINDAITKVKVEFTGKLQDKNLHFHFGNKSYTFQKVKNIKPIKIKIKKTLDKKIIGKWTRAEISAGNQENILKLPIVLNLKQSGDFVFKDRYITRTGEIRTIFSKKGNYYTGQWQAIDNILYIKVIDGYRWEPVGKYKLINKKLFLTLPDGSLETWIKN